MIVTRPAPDGAAFAASAAEKGFAPVLSPVMEISINKTPLAAEDLATIGALAFTSANGVRAFTANSAQRTLPVFAVGDATAETAIAAGFSAVARAAGETTSLADLIADARHADRYAGAVLHVAGRDRAGDLSADLEARGVACERRVLYRADPVTAVADKAAEALTKGGAWVVFFSPRSAALFMDQVDRADMRSTLKACSAVCLSTPVAMEIDGFGSVAVAKQRNADALLEAAIRHKML